MHLLLHKIEVIVDWIIPPVLAVLLVVIVGELFFSHQFRFYKHYADLFDGFVVLVFAIDLGFKYSRVKKLPTFAKKYWLEIIATIPFFLIFRLLEFLRFSEFVERSQVFAHEAVVAERIEKETAVLVKEAKEAARAGELSRTARMLNTFRALSRFPRLLKALPFYEKPTGQHHWHERSKYSSHISSRQRLQQK